MNQNIQHCDNQKQFFHTVSEKQSITISSCDMNQFIKKFTEFGVELTTLRTALLAHQANVRRVLLDSGVEHT